MTPYPKARINFPIHALKILLEWKCFASFFNPALVKIDTDVFFMSSNTDN